MKLLIIGHAGHGKTELAKILNEHYHIEFGDVSEIAAQLFIFDALKEKYEYATWQDCHADRGAHRQEWADLIDEFNKEDAAALAKKVYEFGDIYCGARRKREFDAIVALGAFVVWIDASERLPKEVGKYMQVSESDAHYVVNNNGTYPALVRAAKRLHARVTNPEFNKDPFQLLRAAQESEEELEEQSAAISDIDAELNAQPAAPKPSAAALAAARKPEAAPPRS